MDGWMDGWMDGCLFRLRPSDSYRLRLLDMLEGMLADGGCLVEYHSSSLFPKRWFKHVVVLTCDNEVLYKRLVQRGYPQHKVQGQVECEIMRVPLDEALEAYPVMQP